MLSVQEAQAKVVERVRPLEPRVHPLGPTSPGLVLAEDVASDMDMPPYDKSMMDGYAICSADLAQGLAELTVIEEVTAGQVPRLPLTRGQATRIMTGAPLPVGADAVVMVERTSLSGSTVRIDDNALKPGQNIMRRSTEMRAGETVLSKGARLRPQELALLATVGRTTVHVRPAARVAVLSTGDEIVEAPEKPGPGQIRNGNGPMLMAQSARAGAVPTYLGIARDRLESLMTFVEEGLRADVLILSGGVSAGTLDLVPKVLADLGVEAVFHKVTMKPGKPVFFGVKSEPRPSKSDQSGCLIFGLPGNPVSAYVCFELFVRPAIRGLMGLEPGPKVVKAALAENFKFRTDRPTYHPARLETEQGSWAVQPVPWLGSPDLRAVTAANAFVILPPGDHAHQAGTMFDVLKVEDPV
jgi:molybdopterin molybdotransferase